MVSYMGMEGFEVEESSSPDSKWWTTGSLGRIKRRSAGEISDTQLHALEKIKVHALKTHFLPAILNYMPCLHGQPLLFSLSFEIAPLSPHHELSFFLKLLFLNATRTWTRRTTATALSLSHSFSRSLSLSSSTLLLDRWLFKKDLCGSDVEKVPWGWKTWGFYWITFYGVQPG